MMGTGPHERLQGAGRLARDFTSIEPTSSTLRLTPALTGVRGRQENGLRRTIKLTDRQAKMVLAMFAGSEEDDQYSDEEIRELLTLIWEWQWGVGRALISAFNTQRRMQAAE
jgi:hypothetical protein